ncbi:MAG: hypothetical protein M4579_000081 [Chaenotheca gracillima]|nr:MAG: hypothetical protein M4579_000081 [Chaenotheca gracillima]
MVTWDQAMDHKLFVALIKSHDIKVDWAKLAKAIGEDVTVSALKHRIARIKNSVTRPDENADEQVDTATGDSATPGSKSKPAARKRGPKKSPTQPKNEPSDIFLGSTFGADVMENEPFGTSPSDEDWDTHPMAPTTPIKSENRRRARHSARSTPRSKRASVEGSPPLGHKYDYLKDRVKRPGDAEAAKIQRENEKASDAALAPFLRARREREESEMIEAGRDPEELYADLGPKAKRAKYGEDGANARFEESPQEDHVTKLPAVMRSKKKYLQGGSALRNHGATKRSEASQGKEPPLTTPGFSIIVDSALQSKKTVLSGMTEFAVVVWKTKNDMATN